MQYSVKIPGFEGQDIKVDEAKFFKAPKVHVNGEQAPKGSRWLTQSITNNDGEAIDVRVSNNFVDPIPSVMVGKEKFHPTEPLSWGQLIWAGWPIVLVAVGGLIGALFGIVAAMVNGRIMRKEEMSTGVKYAITGAIAFVAAVVSIGISVGLTGAIS